MFVGGIILMLVVVAAARPRLATKRLLFAVASGSLVLSLGACSLLQSIVPQRREPSDDNAPGTQGLYGDISRAGANYMCTIGTSADAHCLEVAGFPSASAPRHTRSEANRQAILGCYRTARVAIENSRSYERLDWNHLREVDKFSAQFADAPGLGDDPASKRCLSLTDEQTQGQFAIGIAMHKEKTRLRETFTTAFAKACKIGDALIQHNDLGNPLQVVLNTRPKKPNPKVAIENSAPAYKILCSGDVLVGDERVPPVIASDFLTDKESCVLRCAEAWDNNDVCNIAIRSGAACKARCEPRCAGKR